MRVKAKTPAVPLKKYIQIDYQNTTINSLHWKTTENTLNIRLASVTKLKQHFKVSEMKRDGFDTDFAIKVTQECKSSGSSKRSNYIRESPNRSLGKLLEKEKNRILKH